MSRRRRIRCAGVRQCCRWWLEEPRDILTTNMQGGVGQMVHALVPSDRVETAAVYGRDGQKIGTIERLMLEKKSGTVAYAVVKCGGFIKAHICHFPLPWSSLRYDLARKAYETDLTLEEVQRGASELDDEAFDWGDRSPAYCHPHYWTV
jgi:hypothetical protein